MLNLVMGSLFLLAVFGSFAERHMHGEPPRWDFVIASVLGAFWGFTAAYLLHRRRPSGYLASFPCLLFMLAAIPLGTVFGILGLTWLNKGRSALTEP
ncbi:MAG: hypothetical protein KDM91_22940 [Verrucomicrobiae bacterium]|nr:hypothetical protein [Verrucomicrobiae bacterium]